MAFGDVRQVEPRSQSTGTDVNIPLPNAVVAGSTLFAFGSTRLSDAPIASVTSSLDGAFVQDADTMAVGAGADGSAYMANIWRLPLAQATPGSHTITLVTTGALGGYNARFFAAEIEGTDMAPQEVFEEIAATTHNSFSRTFAAVPTAPSLYVCADGVSVNAIVGDANFDTTILNQACFAFRGMPDAGGTPYTITMSNSQNDSLHAGVSYTTGGAPPAAVYSGYPYGHQFRAGQNMFKGGFQ